MGADNADADDLAEPILSTLRGGAGEDGRSMSMNVKKLRKQVLLTIQSGEDDKAAKKRFKRAVQALEAEGKVKLDGDGLVELIAKSAKFEKKKKKKKEKKEKRKSQDGGADEGASKKKKQKKDDGIQVGDAETRGNNDDDQHGEGEGGQGDTAEDFSNDAAATDADKNKPCKGNPSGVTRLFLGNLPFSVDEASLQSFLPGELTHTKWITDKETGKFYGSAFVEMKTSRDAAEAVAKAGADLMGRPVKINFAPSRPGDIWPPRSKVVSGGGGGGQAGGSGVKAMSVKPEGCMKLFIGNLSYDIDDEQITKFFGNVEAEVKAVRWLHHKDSGDFKGVGFVEFWNTEACEKAATLNGKVLLGRPIRIDWTD